jgi:hypothetical protein
VREDNIDLGEGIIPIHILNLTCAVHLRQEHGFKRWQISKFLETYPWLIREDGTFAFAALHRLVHVMVHAEEAVNSTRSLGQIRGLSGHAADTDCAAW